MPVTESAHGIIYRTRRFAETSLIVSWMTPTCGRLSTMARGALRPKSPLRGKLDLFYEADFSFSRSRRSDLHMLGEALVTDAHPGLRQDLGLLRQAAYAATLIEQSTEADTPLPALFELFQGFLRTLAGPVIRPQFILAFELKLLGELGLQPELERTPLSAGARQLAKALAAGDWAMAGQLRLSAGQMSELRQFLGGFILYHLGRVPKGRNAALRS